MCNFVLLKLIHAMQEKVQACTFSVIVFQLNPEFISENNDIFRTCRSLMTILTIIVNNDTRVCHSDGTFMFMYTYFSEMNVGF